MGLSLWLLMNVYKHRRRHTRPVGCICLFTTWVLRAGGGSTQSPPLYYKCMSKINKTPERSPAVADLQIPCTSTSASRHQVHICYILCTHKYPPSLRPLDEPARVRCRDMARPRARESSRDKQSQLVGLLPTRRGVADLFVDCDVPRDFGNRVDPCAAGWVKSDGPRRLGQ